MGQIPHLAQVRRKTCTSSTSSSTWEEEISIQRRASKIVQFGNRWTSSGTWVDWINSVVLVSKHDGSIRLCLDPRDINKSIKKNEHYTKTIDEVSAESLGGKYFTLTDVKSGYWMVELDNESSLLITFNIPWASVFPLVLKSAQTYFSRGYINVVPKKVKEIMGCIDDIITREVDSKDHDVNLLQLLETARMNGIKLNPKKLQFKTTKCNFFGQISR